MKKPKTPPFDSSDLTKLLEPWGGDIEKLFDSRQRITYQGKYIHWDDLIRRNMPSWLTHEQVWSAIKFLRMGMWRHIPLTDKNGRSFAFLLLDSVHELLRTLDMEAGGTIRADDMVPNQSKQKQYIVRSLMEEAITSSQLEGATATRRAAKDMLESGRKPRNHSEQMILNNYGTMLRIRKLKDKKLTPEMVFDIHKRIAINTLEESECGRFRTGDEPIDVVENNSGEILHTPPHAAQLHERMEKLCAFANGETPDYFIHPIIRSIMVHFWLSYDHPFVDGNGRCARSLFYWSMLHNGYWLAEYISISSLIKKAPAKYARAFLLSETDDNDLTYFILYHLALLKRSIDKVQKYIKDKTAETVRLTARLEGMRELNHRQRDLIGHALRNPGFEYTVKSHGQKQNVARHTARTDLYDLTTRGFLEQTSTGKTFTFYAVPDLEKKLKH